MRPPQDTSRFMTPSRPAGWVRHGERWGLWWCGKEVASVAPDGDGVLVVLAARKIWQDKKVRAASVAQGRRYAERWCAARLLVGIPLRQAVATLTAEGCDSKTPTVLAGRAATNTQQERRLREAASLPADLRPRG